MKFAKQVHNVLCAFLGIGCIICKGYNNEYICYNNNIRLSFIVCSFLLCTNFY
jgi:hypothetical protein